MCVGCVWTCVGCHQESFELDGHVGQEGEHLVLFLRHVEEVAHPSLFLPGVVPSLELTTSFALECVGHTFESHGIDIMCFLPNLL